MKIDDIIRNKRDQLDVEQPPVNLWEGIKKDWKQKSEPSYVWWKIAAVLFLGSTFALIIYTQSLQNQVKQLASLGDISKEYNALEKDYQNQIKVLEASIPLDKMNENQDFSWLIDELNTLEGINKMYQEDLGKGVAKEQLVGVLIDYYEKRIKLLKKLDMEIKRAEKMHNDEARKTQISEAISI
jgi:hypothetical protein